MYINRRAIGNLRENKTIKEIWFGEAAEKIRNNVLNGDYSMCNNDLCIQKKCFDASIMPKTRALPKYVVLSYDRECNLKCIYCRDEKIKNSKEQTEYYNERIYNFLKPILGEIEEIGISGSGEALFSAHSRYLIKKIAPEYPNIIWSIKSNGLFFNTKNCKALGIYGRINEVFISLHALSKPVFDTIMPGSDLDTVVKNIKEAAYECNVNKTIKMVTLHTVVSNLNYKELPAIAEFAHRLDVKLSISPYSYWGTKFGSDYKSAAVWDKDNPEYENFKQILKHPAMNYKKIELAPVFQAVKDEGRMVCKRPFIAMSIRGTGDVYTCCAKFNNFKIGNIKEDNLKDIWYGKEAQELRKKILSGDETMCDKEVCMHRTLTDASILPETPGLPKHVSLSYDAECNLNCVICRDRKYKNSKEETEYLNEKAEKELLPILKEAELITISEAGEALFSPHSRELIKKVSAANKNVMWNINTNGILFTMENLKALGIYGRINGVTVSFHAVNRDIYNKIMRGSDYDTAVKNIRAAAYEYNHAKSIKKLNINAVISTLNYKEIPALAEFAKELNIYLILSQFLWWGDTEFGKDYKSVSVWDKEHPEFENFKQILKHPALEYENIIFTPRFKEIRETENERIL